MIARALARVFFYQGALFAIAFILAYSRLESRAGEYLLSSVDSAGMMAMLVVALVGFPAMLLALESRVAA